MFLAHTLAVNDVLIAADLLSRHVARVSVAAMLHERDLKRVPVYVDAGDGQRIAVVPDGWLDLRVGGSRQMCLALEVDRGTEEQKAWRRKVRGLVAYTKGPYQERFKTTSLTVAVVATPGERRLRELIRWTEAELAAIGESANPDLFRFSNVAADRASPEEIFLGACWYRPLEIQAVPLIDGLDQRLP